jgi:hypothetical protein
MIKAPINPRNFWWLHTKFNILFTHLPEVA